MHHCLDAASAAATRAKWCHTPRCELPSRLASLLLSLSLATPVAARTHHLPLPVRFQEGDATAALLTAAVTTALLLLIAARSSVGKLCYFGTDSSPRHSRSPPPSEALEAERGSCERGDCQLAGAMKEEDIMLAALPCGKAWTEDQEDDHCLAALMDLEFEAALAREYDKLLEIPDRSDLCIPLGAEVREGSGETELSLSREYEDAMACEYEAALAHHLYLPAGVTDTSPEERDVAVSTSTSTVAGVPLRLGADPLDVDVPSREERCVFWRRMLQTLLFI